MKKECWGHRVRRVWDGKVQGWPGPWGLAAGRAQHLQGHENNLSPLADAAPGRSRCILGLAMYSVTSYRSAACCSKSGRCGLWPMAVCKRPLRGVASDVVSALQMYVHEPWPYRYTLKPVNCNYV